ncbi:GTP pyrophosphokinase [Lactobacillus sp. S2-2]|uniref:GTP pyrophosphokinase n=1 Tax=Lactobacillus sp. S2-2 TaxID=2692917 RepID=UPI001F25BD6C|nr:GTP pyrophosphokinase family protein [Lactobacillus sp. S2-2]MCF6514841.1 GTP pyrophosphokinase [Lactobacillus sp. S2-2]
MNTLNKNWNEFFFPYNQASDELKVKLKGIRKEYQQKNKHSPIEFVTGRIKSVSSIQEKMKRRYIDEDRLEQDMEDICGIRIMTEFIDDIYDVVKLLRQRNDINIISERDYVNNEKSSGYRSYHIVLEYPVQLIKEEKIINVEIQIRTLAMNFWATLEHSLSYKHSDEFPPEIHEKLQKSAEQAYDLDISMSEIQKELNNHDNLE